MTKPVTTPTAIARSVSERLPPRVGSWMAAVGEWNLWQLPKDRTAIYQKPYCHTDTPLFLTLISEFSRLLLSFTFLGEDCYDRSRLVSHWKFMETPPLGEVIRGILGNLGKIDG